MIDIQLAQCRISNSYLAIRPSLLHADVLALTPTGSSRATVNVVARQFLYLTLITVNACDGVPGSDCIPA